MRQQVVYRAPAKERKALYRGKKVALMVNWDTKKRWINPTQEMVDKQLASYQVFIEAGGEKCCTIGLRKMEEKKYEK